MQTEPKCLYCGQTGELAPLVNLTYKGRPLWICAGHLPLLIHKPEEIQDQLEQSVQDA